MAEHLSEEQLKLTSHWRTQLHTVCTAVMEAPNPEQQQQALALLVTLEDLFESMLWEG